MGNCVSQNEAYTVLRTSIVGVLIPCESEFAEFFDCCKVEKHGLKSVLNINLLQSFYVVVSGEVQVCLTSKDGKSAVINSFKAGEMIHFFRANSISCSGGGIVNSVCKLRLNLQFKSDADNIAQVIGIDRASVDRFLDGKPHLKELRQLLNLQITDFKDFPPFIQLALSQLQFLGPLLKLRMHHVGDILRYADDGNAHSKSWQPIVPHIKRNKLQKLPPVTARPIGLILSGSYFILPHDADAETLAQEYVNTILCMNTTVASSPNLSHSHPTPAPITVEKGTQELGGTEDRIIYARIMQTVAQMLQVDLAQIFPGSVFGLDYYFIKNYSGQKPIVMSAGCGLVGFLEFDTLRYLFHYEKRLKRVMQRNYLSSILSSVKRLVPILSDMDVKTMHIFAGIVFMKQLEKGDFLYRKNQSSSHCYLIVSGLVKELNALEENHLSNHPDLFATLSQKRALAELSSFANENDASPDKKFYRQNASLLQIYGAGSLLGEVAVMAGAMHFSTMIISEPTTVIVIPRSTFHRMLYETKYSISPILYNHHNSDSTKPQGTNTLGTSHTNVQNLYHYYSNNIIATELHIAKMGTHAELCHILPHPIANALFLDFLAKEAAEENLLFLNEVRKFHLLSSKCQRDMQTLLWSRMYMKLASNPAVHTYLGDHSNVSTSSHHRNGSNHNPNNSPFNKDSKTSQAPVPRSLTSRLFGLVKSNSNSNSSNNIILNTSNNNIHNSNKINNNSYNINANAPMLTQPGRQASLMSSMLRSPSALGLKVIIEQEFTDEENLQSTAVLQNDTTNNIVTLINNTSFSDVRPFSVAPSPMSISGKDERPSIVQPPAVLKMSSFSSITDVHNNTENTIKNTMERVNVNNNNSSNTVTNHNDPTGLSHPNGPLSSGTNMRPINATSAVLLTAQYRHQQEEHAQYVKRHHLLTEVSFVASSIEFAAAASDFAFYSSSSPTIITTTPSGISSKNDPKEDKGNIKQGTLIANSAEDFPDVNAFQRNVTKQEGEYDGEDDIFSRPPPSSKYLPERIPSFLDHHLSANHLNTTAVQLLKRISPHNSSNNNSNNNISNNNNKSWVQAAVTAIQQATSPLNRHNFADNNNSNNNTSVENIPLVDKSDVHQHHHNSLITASTMNNTLSTADIETTNATTCNNNLSSAHDIANNSKIHSNDGEDLVTLAHQEASLHMTILCEYFLGQVHTLRGLFENIICTYIATDSIRQVNLPYNILKRILDVYETGYRHRSDEDILLEMIEQLHNDMAHNTNTSHSTNNNATINSNVTMTLDKNIQLNRFTVPSLDEEEVNKVAAAVVTGQSTLSTSNVTNSSEKEHTNIVSFFTVFNAAEMEIMLLLKNGPFHRWRNTPIFNEFIQLVGPAQDPTAPLVHQQSSLELSSIKQMKPTRNNSFKYHCNNDGNDNNDKNDNNKASSSLRKSFHDPGSRRESANVNESADCASLNNNNKSAEIGFDLCRVLSVADPTATALATSLIPDNSPVSATDRSTYGAASSPVALSRSIRRSISNLLPSPMTRKNPATSINRLSSEKDAYNNKNDNNNSLGTLLHASLLYQQTQDSEFPIPVPLDLINNNSNNNTNYNDGNDSWNTNTSDNKTNADNIANTNDKNDFSSNISSSKLSMRQSSMKMLQRVSSVVALSGTHNNSRSNNSFFRNLSNSHLLLLPGGHKEKEKDFCTSAKAAAWVQLMIQQEQLLHAQHPHNNSSNTNHIDNLAASVLQNNVLREALQHMHQQGALSPPSDLMLSRGESTPKMMISPQTSSTSINFHVMASRKHRDVAPIINNNIHNNNTHNCNKRDILNEEQVVFTTSKDNTHMLPKTTTATSVKQPIIISKNALSLSQITHESNTHTECPLIGNDYSNVNTINTSAKTTVNNPSLDTHINITHSSNNSYNNNIRNNSRYWLKLPNRNNSRTSSSKLATKPSPYMHNTTIAVMESHSNNNIDHLNHSLSKPRPTYQNADIIGSLSYWFLRHLKQSHNGTNNNNSNIHRTGWFVGSKKSNIVGISG